MASRHVTAVVVIQDVRSGSLIVSQASDPQALNEATNLLPLSFVKVLTVTSWWDNNLSNQLFQTAGQADESNPAFRREVDAHNILAGGSDTAGKELAVALRQAVGETSVLQDMKRYQVLTSDQEKADPLAALRGLDDARWADVLSIGETNVETTVLRMSQFLQAVGNYGKACEPRRSSTSCLNAREVLQPSTATKLQRAFLDTVRYGTAIHIVHSLDRTGWTVGGKTGTGGKKGAPLDKQDGCFAGLLFDTAGRARFTVVVYVQGAGPGAGAAGEIAAEAGRFLAGE